MQITKTNTKPIFLSNIFALEKSEPRKLKRPVEILADLLKNGGAYLRESDFSMFPFRKAPWSRPKNLVRTHSQIPNNCLVAKEIKTNKKKNSYIMFYAPEM